MSTFKLLVISITFIFSNAILSVASTNTCTVSEFQNDSNDLKAFLMVYQSQLDNSIGPIYDTFNKISFNKQNILQLSSIDLQQILKHNGLENHHIDRLVNVLHDIQDSQIHQEMKESKSLKSTTQKKVVKLSKEEEKALENIKNVSNTLEQHLSELTVITHELEENYVNAETLINERFDLLVNTINKRRNELLVKLGTIKANKSKPLSKQMNELNIYKRSLMKVYDESQKLIRDESVSANRRKRKIIRKTSKLLDATHIIPTDMIHMNTAYIQVRINTRNIVKELQEFGVVEGRKSEIMTMKTDLKRPQQTSFIFGTITNGYKHWISQKGKTLKVVEKVDGFVTTCNPKSYSSGIHIFKIHVNGKVTGKNALSIVSGTMPTARMYWISEHTYKHYYFGSKNGVIYTGKDKQLSKLKKWKKHDVIVMTIDCNEWTLTFDIKNNRLPRARAQKIKITKNKYYTCLTVEPKKGVKFGIVDSTW